MGKGSCSSQSSFCPLPSPALLAKISSFLCTPCSPLKLTVSRRQTRYSWACQQARSPGRGPISGLSEMCRNEVHKRLQGNNGERNRYIVVLGLSVGLIKVIPGAAHDMTTDLTTQLLNTLMSNKWPSTYHYLPTSGHHHI